MEVKINREIRDFSEAVFFGMSLRQCCFAVVACVAAVALYFALDPYLGIEELSWVCILGAAPFAAAGFVRWHGMTAEQFVWVWVKSELIMPKRLISRPENLYFDAHGQGRKSASGLMAVFGSKPSRAEVAGHSGDAPAKPAAPTLRGLRARLRTLYVHMLADLYAKASGKRDTHDKDAL